jgi:hypothetical protein
MIQWLRTRSSPLRYLVYVAGVLLAFFVAVGVGAGAAVVVGWQSGGAAPGSANTSKPGGSNLETTGATQASEDTAIESSGGSKSSGKVATISFVHRATDKNSRGDYTYINDPRINRDPKAVILASPTSDRGNSASAYQHNIGVWYEPVARKWAIFNQDRTPVPAGSEFKVEIPDESASLIHHADLLNTAGNYTYLDNKLTNGKPDAVLTVTQNWNPGGGGGVYNNHPVGVLYDAKVQKWAVYNRDGVPMPGGAAFNVAVSAGASELAK